MTSTQVSDTVGDAGEDSCAGGVEVVDDLDAELKALGGQPDYALGSVHAVTRDGTLVVASASGSQLASYAWGARNEDARAYAAYGQNSSVRKILEIRLEPPGRTHIVLIRQPVGF